MKAKSLVLGVACPTCYVPIGRWCVRPSEHRAMELHRARRDAADLIVRCPHCGARPGQPCIGSIPYHRARSDRAVAALREALRAAGRRG